MQNKSSVICGVNIELWGPMYIIVFLLLLIVFILCLTRGSHTDTVVFLPSEPWARKWSNNEMKTKINLYKPYSLTVFHDL